MGTIVLYEKHKGDKEFVLPCISFSVKERALISEHGFVTFPEFIDNFYVKEGRPNLKRFLSTIRKYRGSVHYAIVPDYQEELGLTLKRKFPDIKWIWPLHQRKNAEWAVEHFDMVGYPYREPWRDYNMRDFLSWVPYDSRWYLGFWDEANPEILLQFKGMDTTLPETYSGKYGKLWNGWKNYEKPPPPGMRTIDIFHHNLHSFVRVLSEIGLQTQLHSW